MVPAQIPFVILSLPKDLGSVASKNGHRLFICSAKILRLKHFVLRSE